MLVELDSISALLAPLDCSLALLITLLLGSGRLQFIKYFQPHTLKVSFIFINFVVMKVFVLTLLFNPLH